MQSIIDFDKPTRCIVHLENERNKGLETYYQVCIDPDPANFSPLGDFIRFNFVSGENEIHGWKRVDDVIVDEVLEDQPATKEDTVLTVEAANG